MTDQPMAAAPCEHHFEYRILGGQPISVGICTLCRTPDWADLYEQAAGLYRWGWTEGRDGKPAREKLSAYDKPRETEAGGETGTHGGRWSIYHLHGEQCARTTMHNSVTSRDGLDNSPSWQPDETLDYGHLPPPAADPDATLRTGVALPKEQP